MHSQTQTRSQLSHNSVTTQSQLSHKPVAAQSQLSRRLDHHGEKVPRDHMPEVHLHDHRALRGRATLKQHLP